jgi:hypothetical protein
MQLAIGLLAKTAATKTPQQVWRMNRQMALINAGLIKRPERECRSWCGLRYYQRWYKPF